MNLLDFLQQAFEDGWPPWGAIPVKRADTLRKSRNEVQSLP